MSIRNGQQQHVNIILFGETGIGKTTFINALKNYLSYTSLDEAMRNELQYAIPCSFTYTDVNYNPISVDIGNPVKAPIGCSDTQQAASYYFDIFGTGNKLHLIDTPGIGDTRGALKDQENIQKTIDYIGQFPGLNSIMILLKPNESRFTAHFRYCFKELMVNLNKRSAPNICFCFTHSKATFYAPGETMHLLKQMILTIEEESKLTIPCDPNNIFCVDNDAFRFLAIKKQGLSVEQSQVDGYKQSWEKSYDTISKMIIHSTKLKLTSTEDIVLLKDARKALLKLARPVAEISRTIQKNKKLAEDKVKELKTATFDYKDLMSKLNIKQESNTREPLPYPKTVCGNSACVQYIMVNGVETTNYKNECHDHCYVTGIPADTIGFPGLTGCEAFQGSQTCKKCSHDLSQHLHIRYIYKKIMIDTLDQWVQDKINNKKSQEEVIQQAIKSAKEKIVELEEEQDKIIKASADLASYIKSNGIMYYNPDLEEYLDLLIKEEEDKKGKGANDSTVLDGLRNVKDVLKAQIKIYEESLKLSSGSKSSDDIKKILNDLANLKINGIFFKDIVDQW